MLAVITRTLGTTRGGRLGSVLIVTGLLLVGYSFGSFLGLLPGGYTSVPEPVALSGGQRSARLESPTMAPPLAEAVSAGLAHEPAASTAQSGLPDSAVDEPASVSGATLAPGASPAAAAPAAAPSAFAAPAPGEEAAVVTASARPAQVAVPMSQPADAIDRLEAATSPRPGVPVRLLLPSIKVDTEVKPGGLVPGPSGESEWETLPFVATNYPDLGPVGGVGNPVISGHVVTLHEGNVFRDLYQVELGETIEVFTADSRFVYVVDEIRLVEPSAVEVMFPTTDERLTLITCGGTFDPRTRTFSERLIVIGKLVGGERL